MLELQIDSGVDNTVVVPATDISFDVPMTTIGELSETFRHSVSFRAVVVSMKMRHYGYNLEEAELRRPVVRRLMRLMELRNNQPVFTDSNPVVECLENGRVLRIERTFRDAGTVLTVNFDTLESQISLKNQDCTREIRI